MTFIPEPSLQNVRVITAAGSVSHLAADYAIIISKTISAITQVNLLAAPNVGTRVLIKDGTGVAPSFPITINANSSYTIDGSPAIQITQAFGSVELFFTGATWAVIDVVNSAIPKIQSESAEATIVTSPAQTIYSGQTPGIAPSIAGPFDTWTLSAVPGIVVHNQVLDTTTTNAISLAYHNHATYYQNSQANWYQYVGAPTSVVTNYVANSSNLGAATGSPGTLPTGWTSSYGNFNQTIAGFGTDGATQWNYIDIRYNQVNPTSTPVRILLNAIAGDPVIASTAYTFSVALGLPSGSNANVTAMNLHIDEYTAQGNYVTTDSSFVSGPATSLTTYSRTATMSSTTAFAALSIIIGVTVGQPVDLTLRIAAVQLQKSSTVQTFQPTPIATTPWLLTNNPLTTSQTISVQTIITQTTNTPFTVSGALTGYSSPPVLQYQDNAGSFVSLPSGAIVTTSSWSFVHPSISSASASSTITVRDSITTSISATSNAYQVTAPGNVTITGVGLANTQVTAGSSVGTLVGAIVVATTGTFTGTLALSGTDAATFAISNGNLVTNGTITARTYSVTITATMTNAIGSPFSSGSLTVTGTSAPAVIHYGSTAPTSLPNVTGAVSPFGWTVGVFEDFLSFNPALTNINSYTPVGASNENPTQKWELGIGDGTFHLNGTLEQEYYVSTGMNSINPFSQSGSVLSITARKPANGTESAQLNGYPYLSGALSSRQFLTTTTGYFECNMKMPPGHGMWSAFWLTGYSTWPPEFDIIEQYGSQPTKMMSACHYGTNNLHSFGSSTNIPDQTTNFNTYGGLVTPNYVAWYCNGVLQGQTSAPLGSSANYFNSSNLFQVVINLALGTGMGDTAVVDSELPATLQIDWFRYSTLGPA